MDRCCMYGHFLQVFLLLILLSYSMGYRYLLVSVQMKSHIAEQMSVGKALISRGHEVYVAVTDGFSMADDSGIKRIIFSRPSKEPSVFYSRENTPSKMAEYFTELFKEEGFMEFSYRQVEYPSANAYDDCASMMSDQMFLRSVKNLAFDFMITDGFILSKCNSILPYHLGIPFAAMFSGPLYEGSTSQPSYTPSLLSTRSDQMTFIQRTMNLFDIIFEAKFIPFSGSWNKTLLRQYPDPDGRYANTWSDVMNRATLFIITRNHILEWPQPTLPDYITLPGITQRPVKPLPKNFENMMTSNNNGVVLVSFGSLFDNLDPTMVQKLFGAFKDNANILFIFKITKADSQILQETVPDNVHLFTWIPQNDLLGHQNLKLFITHCGNNGQHESLYHGVPMIGLPMFADQKHNCQRIQYKGFGICMDTATFTSKELSRNIKIILSDDSYTKNVNKMSVILKEEQLPCEKAAKCIEHVTKYGGEHLRSASRGMHWIQYWMVDVILFIVSVFVIGLILIVCLIKNICKKIARKTKTE